MALDDLEMMANTPVNPADVDRARRADIDTAAAAETMPPPKEQCEEYDETRAGRIARRGQDPPDPAKA